MTDIHKLVKEMGIRFCILGINPPPIYYEISNDRALPLKGYRAAYGDWFDLGCKYPQFHDAVRKLEEDFGCTVYAMIYNSYEELGDMLTLLTISSDESEWEQERDDLKAMQPIAYVHNFTYPEFSEWGTVLLRMNGNELERIG